MTMTGGQLPPSRRRMPNSLPTSRKQAGFDEILMDTNRRVLFTAKKLCCAVVPRNAAGMVPNSCQTYPRSVKALPGRPARPLPGISWIHSAIQTVSRRPWSLYQGLKRKSDCFYCKIML